MSEFQAIRPLPPRPNLEQQRVLAKELLAAAKSGDAPSLDRLQAAQPGQSRPWTLADAQFTLARGYGFPNWASLKSYIEQLSPPELSPAVQRFHRAIDAHDLAALRLTLGDPQAVAAVNAPMSSFGARPIMRVKTDLPMVDLLIEHGADLNLRSDWWAGPFGILDHCSPEQAGPLIERGARLDVFSAAHLDLIEQLHDFLGRDPSLVHARGGDGQTPLHFARSREAVDLLLDAGSDIDARDVDHRSTPAEHMIGDRAELARYLVSRGAAADVFLAAALGDVGRLRTLIERDRGVLALRTGLGDYAERPPSSFHIYFWTLGQRLSPVEVATMRGQTEAKALLLQHADDRARLLAACESADRAVAEALVREKPTLVGQLTLADRGALPTAAWNGRAEAVDLMLDLGFDPTAAGPDSGTVLHCAAWQGNAAIVKSLLARPGLREVLLDRLEPTHHATPLGWCVHGATHCRNPAGNYVAVARLLIDAGAQAAMNVGPIREDVRAEIERPR